MEDEQLELQQKTKEKVTLCAGAVQYVLRDNKIYEKFQEISVMYGCAVDIEVKIKEIENPVEQSNEPEAVEGGLQMLPASQTHSED